MNFVLLWATLTKYKNIFILVCSIFLAVVLAQFNSFFNFLGKTGYLGALAGGLLFVSIFTAFPAGVLLVSVADNFPAIVVAFVAAFGAVVGDLIILKFVRNNVLENIRPVYEQLGGNYLTKIFHTKYFRWTLPVLGAFIIFLPFPDELGISLLGISKIKYNKFVFISFVLNFLGILIMLYGFDFILKLFT